MDLTRVLIDSMTSIDCLSALTSRSGATPSQIKAAITNAIPGLMDSLTRNTSTEEGASALLGALSQHTNSGSMRSQIAGTDLVDGDKIITKILGETNTDFISGISNSSGLDFNQARTILSSIAPAMMSSISAANNVYNDPGKKSGVGSDYPGGTTRSTANTSTTEVIGGPTAPAAAPVTNEQSLKNIVGNILVDEEDRKILDSLQGKSLLQNLKDFIL